MTLIRCMSQKYSVTVMRHCWKGCVLCVCLRDVRRACLRDALCCCLRDVLSACLRDVLCCCLRDVLWSCNVSFWVPVYVMFWVLCTCCRLGVSLFNCCVCWPNASCACLGYGGTVHMQPAGQGSVRLAAVYGHTRVCVCVCIYIYMCVCVCVCV